MSEEDTRNQRTRKSFFVFNLSSRRDVASVLHRCGAVHSQSHPNGTLRGATDYVHCVLLHIPEKTITISVPKKLLRMSLDETDRCCFDWMVGWFDAALELSNSNKVVFFLVTATTQTSAVEIAKRKLRIVTQLPVVSAHQVELFREWYNLPTGSHSRCSMGP